MFDVGKWVGHKNHVHETARLLLSKSIRWGPQATLLYQTANPFGIPS